MTTLSDIAEILADAPRVAGVVVIPAEQAREMAAVARKAAEGVPTLVSRDVLLKRHDGFLTVARLKGMLSRHLDYLKESGIVVAAPWGGDERATWLFDEARFIEFVRCPVGQRRDTITDSRRSASSRIRTPDDRNQLNGGRLRKA